ncbi:hypothetical protein, partial [Streptomyces sp. NPDC006999]|uniref:hypothetical protein n=1 Tax=Streptomyces sp. NPDC006999 TaxID=3156909 RepID=UPI0033D35B81
RRGFRVTTNSTFFNTDTPQTVIEVLNYLNDDLPARRQAPRHRRSAHLESPDDRPAVPRGPVLPRRAAHRAGPRHLRGPARPR